ncbi:MAG: hypothetical protein AAFY84_03135 [Pseudomonadota bacterium]
MIDQSILNSVSSLAMEASTYIQPTLDAARDMTLAHPALVAGGIGASLLALFANAVLGFQIGDSDAAVYRERFSARRKIRFAGNHAALRRLFEVEDTTFADFPLAASGEDRFFTPSVLTDKRGRFYLGNIVFLLEDQVMATSDGAETNVTASVTFRLRKRYLEDFVNFTAAAFAETFAERVHAGVKSEVGRYKRDFIVREQKEVENHLTAHLKAVIEGTPGVDGQSGLGIEITMVTLSIKPLASGRSTANGSIEGSLANMSGPDFVSIEGTRLLSDMLRRAETPREKSDLRALISQQIEAQRQIRCAIELRQSGNLIVLTPDEAGLTRGMVNSNGMSAHLSGQRPERRANGSLNGRLDVPSIDDQTQTDHLN